MLGTILAATLIERFGRKQLLSLSFSGMGLCMLVMSAGIFCRLDLAVDQKEVMGQGGRATVLTCLILLI